MKAGTCPLRAWLTLQELCDWLNITERHARKLVAREAIPYRKVGRLLRFTPAEIEEWSKPTPRSPDAVLSMPAAVSATRVAKRRVALLPKSLIEPDTSKEGDHGARRSA